MADGLKVKKRDDGHQGEIEGGLADRARHLEVPAVSDGSGSEKEDAAGRPQVDVHGVEEAGAMLCED